jgi:hypothetical protein
MTTVALTLLGLGALGVLANWTLLINTLVTKKQEGTSLVLLIGGVLAFAGCLLLPGVRWQLGLIALALDPGCWLLAAPIISALRRLQAR